MNASIGTAPLLSVLEAAILKHNSDWLTCKFSVCSHFLLSLYPQLDRVESANALLEVLNDLAQASTARYSLRHLVDFNFIDSKTNQPVQLNQSSFSRANAHPSYQLWRTCVAKLWPLALQHLPITKFEGLGQVIAVDGSLFDCIARMAWAVYRTDCPKVKDHFFFDLKGVPTKLVLTTSKGNEREALPQNLQAHTTYIIDRGYKVVLLLLDYILFYYIWLRVQFFSFNVSTPHRTVYHFLTALHINFYLLGL